MPSSSIIIPFRNLLSVLLFLPLVFSCRQDDPILPVPPVSGKGETAEVTLSVRIPDFRAANTRGVNDKGIAEITVLMFADEGGTEKVKVKHDIPGSSLHTPSGSSDTKIFNVPVTAGTYKRITLIANAQTELAGITAGSTYDAFKQVEATGKFGQEGTGTYIPMYGEHAPAGGFELKAGVSQTIAQEIPLIRMLAKVDIINPTTSGATTAAGKVYFVNPVGNGRVWVDLATYNTTASQSGYMTPTLPATLQPAVSGGHPLEGTANTASPNVITYYLNEQSATSGGSRPCIVINLAYQGREYYYRMDYTWDGIKGGGTGPYEKGKYMPILRNHHYIFTIKEVKGPGFLTLEEAIQSPENHTNHQNIVVVPIVIDEAFTDITFNESGQFLALTRTTILLKGEHTTASSENRFSVHTNYPSGWKLTAYQYDGTPLPASAWLTPSQTVGAANATVEVQALTQGKGWKFGYFEIQAGRLQHRIDVILLGKLPLEYVAEYNLAGGYQYGSSFYRAFNGDFWHGHEVSLASTSAQTDIPLRWATNHANDQSGYYNAYVCKGLYNDVYNPATKNIMNDAFFTTGAGKNYHIPSYHEHVGAFSDWTSATYGSMVDYQDIPEACEVGGILQTYTSDFYSTGNGIGYALRFKKGTRHTSNEPTVPLAATNSMACAYRYERIGTMATYLNNTDHLKIQCVYIGDQSPLPDLKTKIAQESWWNAQSPSTVVTRILPVTGYIGNAKPATVSDNYLQGRGIWGYYWGSTLSTNQYWLSHIIFDAMNMKVFEGGGDDLGLGLSIRLFSNE